MGSGVSHFNATLAVEGQSLKTHDSVHEPQLLNRQRGDEADSNLATSADHSSALPVGQHGSQNVSAGHHPL